MGICFFKTVQGCLSLFPRMLNYGVYGPLFLRLGLSAVFMVHGYPKLFKHFIGTASWLESIGFKPGKFWALVVGVVEFFGGALLLIGLFVQPVAILLIINMLVAIWKVKFKIGLVDGYEFDLVLLLMALALLVLGGGAYSLDLPL